MSESTLSDSLAAMQPDNDALIAPVTDNWMQGRTTYGGFSSALLLGAVQKMHPNLPPLRSTLINFTGPISKSPRITTQVQRTGRNVTTVSATATIDGKTACLAVFSFGLAQNSDIQASCPAPDAPKPDLETGEPMIPPQAAALAPRFHTNFDMLLIEGDRPMTGSTRGYIRCWVRHRDPASRGGEASLLCLADILPPAVFPMFKRMGPNSSVNWICNFMQDNTQTEDGWWQAESRVSAAENGYSSQVMRIWNSQGDLVVDGMQSVLVFV